MTGPGWGIAPGEDRIRKEIHGNYGGSSQNGISVSAQTGRDVLRGPGAKHPPVATEPLAREKEVDRPPLTDSH